MLKFSRQNKVFLVLALILNGSCSGDRVPSINIDSPESEVERFKIVGLKSAYGNVSEDILLDTVTGETWYLQWEENKSWGRFLTWRKMARYANAIPEIIETSNKIDREYKWSLAKTIVAEKYKDYSQFEAAIENKLKSDPRWSVSAKTLDLKEDTPRGDYENLLEKIYLELKNSD